MKFDPPIPMLAPAQAGTRATFRFSLAQGAFAGQAFTAKLFICPNPCCPCEAVSFHCQPDTEPRGNEVATLVSPVPLYVDLDVMRRAVRPTAESSPDGVALAHAVVAEMGPTDWEQWVQVFLGTKRGQMETMNLDTLNAQFPPEVMEGSATMVGYAEVFPWAESFLLTLGGEQWMAEDVYCVDPACACRTALLEFFRVPREPKQRRRPVRFESILRHDYVSGKTVVVERKFWSPAVADLMAVLRTAHPGFEQTCRERHRQMKQLARRLLPADVRASRRVAHARAEAGAAEPPADPPTPPLKAAAKVGRNDPCPCGSGKKYKKCCG